MSWCNIFTVSGLVELFLYAFAMLILALTILNFRVYVETKQRSWRLGININSVDAWCKKGVLKEVECPKCGYGLDKIRKPQSLHEALWGGWTCPKCGELIDKWGKSRNKNIE